MIIHLNREQEGKRLKLHKMKISAKSQKDLAEIRFLISENIKEKQRKKKERKEAEEKQERIAKKKRNKRIRAIKRKWKKQYESKS